LTQLPSRAELPERVERVLSRGSFGNPDVLLVHSGEGSVVVKDFAPRNRLVAATIGRWVTRREVRAYRALLGHPNVPRFVGQIDPLSFAVEYRPGTRLGRRLRPQLPASFIDELASAIERMHACGVAHLDLSHRSNVLVSPDGKPVLIDFGSAFCFRPGGLGAKLWLPLLARADRRALEKWRRRFQQPPSASASAPS
jgi:serine/threonine protein kinase